MSKLILALFFAITALFLSTTLAHALVTGTVSPSSVNEATPNVTITFTGIRPQREYFFCLKNGGDCSFQNDLTVSLRANSARIATITICGQGADFVKACETGDYFHQTTYHLGLFADDNGTEFVSDVNFNVGSAQCPAGYGYLTDYHVCGREAPASECIAGETPLTVLDGRNFCTLVNSPVTPSTPGEVNISPFPLPDSPELRDKGFTAGNLIGKLVGDILPIVLGIAGFLTVIFVIISGIQFVTSSGNPEAAAAARSRLIFALVGFALIILAFAITQIVDRIFLGGSGVF